MKIRIAELRDLGSIVNIYNQAIAAGEKTADITPLKVNQRLNWFNEHIPEKYPVYVAEMNGKVTGYLSLSPYRPGRMALSSTSEISYYIDYDYHRRGIAGCLLEFALKKCPELGIKNLFAVLIETNEGSVKLLKKFGFSQWGYLPKVLEYNNRRIGHLYYGLNLS